jgi:hypothetical protein
LNRALYSDSIADFLAREADEILGVLARCSDFAIEQTQRDAWLEEIRILHLALSPCHGSVYFEYSIPRMGRRIDVVLLIGPAIFVLEFKVGEQDFALHALEATEFHLLWRPLAPHQQQGTTQLPQERLSCSANSCSSGHGDHRSPR